MGATPDTQLPTANDDFVPFFKAFCNETRVSLFEQLLSGERSRDFVAERHARPTPGDGRC